MITAFAILCAGGAGALSYLMIELLSEAETISGYILILVFMFISALPACAVGAYTLLPVLWYLFPIGFISQIVSFEIDKRKLMNSNLLYFLAGVSGGFLIYFIDSIPVSKNSIMGQFPWGDPQFIMIDGDFKYPEVVFMLSGLVAAYISRWLSGSIEHKPKLVSIPPITRIQKRTDDI
jgi:hypothetical protein